MEITVTSHNNIITSYRCMEDNGPGPLGFSPVVELTKMWLFVCPFLSLALSLFSPLPFLSSLFHPKNYRCCCPSPNLHIFIIFFFLFLFSLSASSFFFFFFSGPPFFFFFLILFLLISSSCPAPDLHRPTLPPQAVLEILRCVSWWPQSSIALSPDNIDGLDFLC